MIQVGQKSACKMCHKEIVFTGKYWEHTGLQPRHPGLPITCEFHGCTEPIISEDAELNGMKLCEGHDREFDGYFNGNDLGGAIRFFLRATGQVESAG